MEKKALGRGIGALIPEKEFEQKGPSIIYINIDKIKPSPFQPRKDFDDEQLADLAQSVKEKGVIQPVLARRRGENYEIIAGERRLRVAKLLGFKELPVIIKDVDDKGSLELALIENIQRENLNPIEEAYAYKHLIEKFNVTHDEISEVMGKARVSITNILRLLKLPHEIQQYLKKSILSFAHGRALLEIEEANLQRRLAQDAVSKGLSVRELENLVKTFRKKAPKRSMKQSAGREPYISVFEEELQRALATKIRITKRSKRGHILIDFYSKEDLERIVNVIRGAE